MFTHIVYEYSLILSSILSTKTKNTLAGVKLHKKRKFVTLYKPLHDHQMSITKMISVGCVE